MANIGGINVSVGIDVSGVKKGVDDVQKHLKAFQEKIGKIRLDTMLKGDTFANINRAITTSQKVLQSTFNLWKSDIHDVDHSYRKLTESTITNTSKMIVKYEAAKNKLNEASKAASNLSEQMKRIETGAVDIGTGRSGVRSSLADFMTKPGEDREGVAKRLKEEFKDITKATGFQVDDLMFKGKDEALEFLDKLKVTVLKTEDEAKQAFANVGIEFEKAFKADKILAYKARMEELRNEIKAGINVDKNRAEMMTLLQTKMAEGEKLSQQELFTLRGLYVQKMKVAAIDQNYQARHEAALTVAKSVTDAEARRTQELHKMEIADAKANTELQMGINILKNRATLLSNLEAREKQGIKLTEQQLTAYQQLYVQQKKMQTFKGTTSEAEYKGELQLAKSVNDVLLKRHASVRTVRLENERIRTELKLQINTLENQKLLYTNINKLKALGIGLTKKEIVELKGLNKATHITSDKNAFLSPEWFKYRMKWFLQLRLAWAAWQITTESFRGALEFETEMKKVQSITRATTEELNKLKSVALEVGSTTIFSAKEAAEGMYTLSQAGLSAKEVLLTIKDVAVLASATMFDMKKTAELVVTVMKAWKYEADNTKKATDILATAINASKLSMEDLVTAFGYVSGIAPQLGMSLEETSAALGILSNNGLNASISATSLRAVLAELLQPSTRFLRELKKTNLTIQDVNPQIFSLGEILVKLKKAGWDAANTFKAFERRAAAGAALLISNAEAYQDMVPLMHEHNRAQKMSEEILGSVGNQWKQLKDILIATTSTIVDTVSPGVQSFIQLLGKLAIVAGKVLNIFVAWPIKLIATGWQGITTILTEGFEGIHFEKQIKSLEEIFNKTKGINTEMDQVVTKYRNLSSVFSSINKALKWSVETKNTERSIALTNRAVKLAKDSEIITKEEARSLLEIKDTTQRRITLEDMVNKRFKERERLLASELKMLSESKVISTDLAKGKFVTSTKMIMSMVDRDIKKIELVKKQLEKGQVTEKEVDRLTKEVSDDMVKKVGPLLENMSDEFIEEAKKNTPGFETLIEAYKSVVNDTKKNLYTELAVAGKVTKKIAKVSEDDIDALKKKVGGVADQLLGEDDEDLKSLRKRKDLAESELRLLEVRQTQAEMEGKSGADLDKIYDKILNKKIEIAKWGAEIAEFNGISDDIIQNTLKAEIARANIERTVAKLADRKRDLTVQKETLEYTKKEQEKKIEILDLDGLTAEEVEKRKEALDEIAIIDSLLVILEKQITELEKKSSEEAEKLSKALAAALKEDRERKKVAGDLLYIQTEQERIAKEAANKVSIVEQELAIMEMNKALTIDVLRKEEERLQIRYKELTARIAIVKNTRDEEELLRQRRQIETDILKNIEKQRRASEPLYDAWIRIRDTVKEYHQLLSDVYVDFTQGMVAGITESAYDATGGFQEQEQEIEDIKGKIKELNEEYKEALGEGNTQRAEELKNQIKDLKNEISDLENPIKQVGEVFRQFFKDTIDGIRKMIIEWLVLQTVQMIGNAWLGGGKSTSTGSTSVPMSVTKAAHGGILPHIESFRKFSSGGVTGNPTLALLGDNKSGRELVIPSENIQNDEVSGYTRDREKTPINILNLISNDEIAQAMNSTAGKRVIINHLVLDRERRGPSAMAYSV